MKTVQYLCLRRRSTSAMEPVGIEPTTRTLQVFIAYPWDMRPRTADILLRLSSQTAFQPPGALRPFGRYG